MARTCGCTQRAASMYCERVSEVAQAGLRKQRRGKPVGGAGVAHLGVEAAITHEIPAGAVGLFRTKHPPLPKGKGGGAAVASVRWVGSALL